MQEVLRVQRAILLSDCMRQVMLRRTESRGVHCRSHFPNSSDAWLKKQVVTLRDGGFHFDEIAVVEVTERSHGKKESIRENALNDSGKWERTIAQES